MRAGKTNTTLSSFLSLKLKEVLR